MTLSNKDMFYFFFCNVYAFFLIFLAYLDFLANTSCTILNGNDERYLVSDLRGN
jgi:hypothetical protein